jgi:hypothetical protein
MPDGPLCTTPYKGTSGPTLYKSAGQQLRHLRSRQFPMGVTLSHTQSRYLQDSRLSEGGKVANGGIAGGV